MPERRLFVRLKDGFENSAFGHTFSELETIPHNLLHRMEILKQAPKTPGYFYLAGKISVWI